MGFNSGFKGLMITALLSTSLPLPLLGVVKDTLWVT